MNTASESPLPLIINNKFYSYLRNKIQTNHVSQDLLKEVKTVINLDNRIRLSHNTIRAKSFMPIVYLPPYPYYCLWQYYYQWKELCERRIL